MGLAQEVDPDRGLVLRVERVEHEAGDQAGLADRLLAQDHQLVPRKARRAGSSTQEPMNYHKLQEASETAED